MQDELRLARAGLHVLQGVQEVITDWNKRFLDLAAHIAQWSKDPSTKVGAVIIGSDREVLSTGFNGFPRGIADDGRLNDRALKYPIICHAEENALAQAARLGVSVRGCVMYVTMMPCTRCARLIIQAGIREVWIPTDEQPPERWREDFDTSLALLNEAGVTVMGSRRPKPEPTLLEQAQAQHGRWISDEATIIELTDNEAELSFERVKTVTLVDRSQWREGVKIAHQEFGHSSPNPKEIHLTYDQIDDVVAALLRLKETRPCSKQ